MSRCIAAVVLGCLLLWSPLRAANVNQFIDFSLRASNNALLLPGRLYVPPGASPAAKRPLILFLHGAGEVGTNNTTQINANMDNLLAEAKQRGAFLYAPQTNTTWADTTITTRTATMLDRALAEQNVDINRIYVTGLSMGGGGTWNMLSRYPARFAAGVPIGGVAPAGYFSLNIMLGEPSWAFHARNDATVSVTTSRNVITNLLNAAHETVPAFPSLRDTTSTFQFDSHVIDLHYRELPTGGHGIWPAVYAYEPMYDWLFAHGVPEPSTAALAGLAVGGLVVGRYRKSGAACVVRW